MNATHAVEQLRQVADAQPGLRMLLLYGSRAREDGHDSSDWDLGYLGDDVDFFGLLAACTSALGTDHVDLVNLDRASGLLRFQAARDGKIITESRPGTYDAFAIRAAAHWHDVEPIVVATHRSIAGKA